MNKKLLSIGVFALGLTLFIASCGGGSGNIPSIEPVSTPTTTSEEVSEPISEEESNHYCDEHYIGVGYKHDETHHWRECLNCDYITEYEEHDFEYHGDINIHWGTCTKCHYSTPDVPHVYGEWIVEEEPTFSEPGYHYHVCDYCGNVEGEWFEMPPHEHVAGEVQIKTVDPTCEKDGYQLEETFCEICGELLESNKTNETSRLGHQHLENVRYEWDDNNRFCRLYAHCTDCGKDLYRGCYASGYYITDEEDYANGAQVEYFANFKSEYPYDNFENQTKIVDIPKKSAVKYYKNSGENYYTAYSTSFIYGDVVIDYPLMYNNESVIRLGEEAFKNCDDITSITITPESGIKYIGEAAFSSCDSLESIVIDLPDLVSISEAAFNNCPNLKSVVIKCGPHATIENYLFAYDAKLETVDLSQAYLKTLGASTFRDCKALTSVSLPNTLEVIGASCFNKCESLKHISLPDSLTTLYGSVFENCTSLEQVYLPTNVQAVGNSCFSGCTSLTSVNLPKKLTSVPSSYVSRCTSLASFKIHEGVTSIEPHAFSVCTSLKSIALPSTLKTIGESAFNSSGIESITLPSLVTTFGQSAFERCASLREINLSSNFASIPMYGVRYCTSLTSITLPEGLSSIGFQAFYGCTSLYEVVNLSSLEVIKGASDNGYVAYYALTVIDNVEDKTINVDENGYVTLDVEGNKTLIQYFGDDEEIVIPNNVDVIKSNVFSNNENITSVYIPKEVELIEIGAFNGCSNLESIVIPFVGGSRTENQYLAYLFGSSNINNPTYPSALHNVSFSEGITTIPEKAFYNMINLVEINIPTSVTSIGDNAFDNTRLVSVNVPDSVERIGLGAFDNNNKLKSLSLPFVGESETSHQFFSYVFGATSVSSGSTDYLCYLENVEIRGGSIPQDAFKNCENFSDFTLIIGEGVTHVGTGAVYNAKGLVRIDVKSTAATFDKNPFYSLLDAITVNLYFSSTMWNTYLKTGISFSASSFGCVYLYLDGSEEYATSITVPGTIKTVPMYAFSNISGVKEIIFEEGVETVRAYAISACSDLESIVIPESMVSFSANALNYSKGYGGFYTENGVNYIAKGDNPYYLLHDADKFDGTDFVVNSNTKLIARGALASNKKIKSVTVGFIGTKINVDGYFYQLFDRSDTNLSGDSVPNNIKTINIVGDLESVGSGAFRQCRYVETISLPNTVEEIGTYAFTECQYLANFTFPTNLKTVGNGAFNKCSSLTSIILPDGVTSVGASAFKGCSKVTEIVIPDTVISIGKGIITDCKCLVSITIPFIGDGGENSYFRYFIDEDSGNGNHNVGADNIKTITITGDITEIGEKAFYYLEYLETVNFKDTVTSIKNYAFYGCDRLASISIGKDFESFGVCALSASYGNLVIEYAGTINEFKSISFGSSWKDYSATCMVKCTNGTFNATNWRG